MVQRTMPAKNYHEGIIGGKWNLVVICLIWGVEGMRRGIFLPTVSVRMPHCA